MLVRPLIIFLILFCVDNINLDAQSFSKDSLYFDKGELLLQEDLDSAFYYFNLAEPIAKKNENWKIYIDCYNGRAYCHYIKGDFSKAEEEMVIAEKEAKKYISENDIIYSAILNNLGTISTEKGNFRNSLKYLKKSAKIDVITQATKVSKAETFHNISVAYRELGDFDQGIFYESKALQLRADTLGVNSLKVALSQIALGHLYRDKGQLDESLNYYYNFLSIIQSLDIYPKNYVHQIIYCYQSIGEIFIKKEKHSEALKYIEKALDLQTNENSLRKSQSYEILGDWYMSQNRFTEAINNHLKSKENYDKNYNISGKTFLKARITKNIASAYLANGDIDEALNNYQSALINLSLGFENNDINTNPNIEQMLSQYQGLEIIYGKSQAFLKQYHKTNDIASLNSAFQNFQFASEIIQSLRNNFIATGSKNELAEKSLEIYEGGIQTAFLLYKKTKETKYLEAAWSFAEQNKSRLLEESLQEDYARVAGGLPKQELELEQNLRIEINFFEKKINQEQAKTNKKNEAKIKLWTSTLFDLKNKYTELTERFENQYPKYYELKYAPKNTSIDKLRSKVLTSKNALLEFFVGTENIYLFCLTKDDLKAFEIDKSATFSEDITSVRSIIKQSPFRDVENFDATRNQFVQLSHRLYNTFLADAINSLSKNVDQLIFIPDDLLAYLPFELLLTEKTKDGSTGYAPQFCNYLFNEYTISYNYSAKLLAEHSQWKAQSDLKPFLGFAPSFGEEIAGTDRACTGENIYNLQCSSQEVNSINNLLKGKIFENTTANVNTFKEQAQQARILHLATHACIDEENPALNKIYFADDYITSNDLYNIDLNAELAVLSACNTGSGKLIKGEGVMSLSRGFILSGCPSTLMSLWSVDDCATAKLMTNFYQKIKEGLGKDNALRMAKLDYLSTADKVNTHPYYWAAFVLSGNADPMTLSNSNSKYWLLLTLFIPLFFLLRKKRIE